MKSIMFRRQVGISKWNLGIVLVFGVLTAPPARGQCEQAKLTASDAMENDAFGRSVDMDRDYLVVGAPTLAASPARPGAAYVYRLSGINWTEQQKLSASDGAPNNSFGRYVSMSGDIIVVGASGAEHQGTKTGAVYVFRRINSTWIEEAKIVPGDAAQFDRFGADVAIDGNYMAVGASGHDQPESGAGAVYIYWFDGDNWVQQDKLTASDAGASTGLGTAVSLFGDVLVARSFVENAGYVFRRTGTTWSEEAKLIPSGLVAEDEIADVAVHADEILIGYTQPVPKPTNLTVADSTSGAVFVFRSFAGSWVEAGELSSAELTPFAHFGHSIDISDSRLVIGAIGSEFTSEGGTGSAFIFERIGFSWVSPRKITASDGSDLSRFGYAVGINGDYFLVGAPGHDDACPGNPTCNSGVAYVYWLKSSPACEAIPAISQWGAAILLLLLVCAATITIRKQRVPRRLGMPIVMMLFAFWSSDPAYAELRPRTPLPKADRVVKPDRPSQLQIKFRNVLKVRAVDGNLSSLTEGVVGVRSGSVVGVRNLGYELPVVPVSVPERNARTLARR